MSGHETMPQSSRAPSLAEQEVFRSMGLELDEAGRPLHPWHASMPDLLEGKGFYWKWGPNYTVDPIVITREEQPKILLIRRRDNGKIALPGGFIDDNEQAPIAGKRELAEETGLVMDDDTPCLCYQGPVHDERSRLHAWSDTTALLWHRDSTTPIAAGDDAADAQWVNLGDVRSLTDLHGSHATLIEMAIRDHGDLSEQLEYFGNESEFVEPAGGHMGYRRVVASLPHGSRIFVKRHDTEKFTDPTRAEHSKRYLRKEYYVYEQLRDKTVHIPQHVELVGDHTLLLDAYDPRDGWHWKAPADIELRRHYIDDVIAALHSLEKIEFTEFPEINPSYQTIVDEGWGMFPHQREQIITKLVQSSVEGATELATHLDELYEQAIRVAPPELAHFAHFDIRQSNIAWHPEHGVRIVDWSWADRAPGGIDTTSFLIDLAKAGHDITDYSIHLDANHTLLLIGFWLGHSIWPTPNSDHTVREHQIGSAVSAFRLLERLSKQG